MMLFALNTILGFNPPRKQMEKVATDLILKLIPSMNQYFTNSLQEIVQFNSPCGYTHSQG